MEFGGTRIYMAPEQEVGELVPVQRWYLNGSLATGPFIASGGTSSSNIVILCWLCIRRWIQTIWKRISNFVWGEV
jgi:hypothetical protein